MLRAVLRDAMLLAANAASERVINRDLRAVVEPLAIRYDAPSLARRLDALSQAEQLLDGNVNPRMVLEDLLLVLAGLREPALRSS